MGHDQPRGVQVVVNPQLKTEALMTDDTNARQLAPGFKSNVPLTESYALWAAVSFLEAV